jgi:hypothetical protein
MKPLKLITVTYNSVGNVTSKVKTINILPLDVQIERDKLKGKEWK